MNELNKSDNCEWEEDEDGNFETGCAHIFTFTTDGIHENHFAFCPYCGGVIVVAVDAGDLLEGADE